MKRRNGFAILMTIFAGLVAVPTAWAQRTPCEALIPAMILDQRIESRQINARLLIEDLLSDKYHSFADVKKSYTNIVGGFDGLSLDMTGDDSQENFEKWREKLRSYRYDNSTSSVTFSQRVQTVAESVVTAFNQCVHDEGSGLHVWMIVDPDNAKNFSFYANYISTDDRHTTLTIRSDIKIPAEVKCTPNPNLRRGEKLGRSVQALSCSRTDAENSVALQLSTRGGGSPIRTAKAQKACEDTATVRKESCPYPNTGQVAVRLTFCKDRKKIDPPLRSEIPELTNCKPTACRNETDIVKELSIGMLGAPLSIDAIKPIAEKIKSGASTVKGIIIDVASTTQFYERVVAKEIRDMPGQTVSPFESPIMPDGRTFADWGINVVVGVRSWGLGLPPDPIDTLRWIALRNDDSVGAFGYSYSHGRVIRHMRSVLAHPSFNDFVGISGDNQIPPRLVGNRSLRYSPDPGSCPAIN